MVTPKEAYWRLSEEARQKIEETAVALYANLPYNEVTARRICGTLKINSATLYRWFDSKDDLYIYLMEKLYKRRTFPADMIWNMDDFLVPEVNQGEVYTEDEQRFLMSWVNVPDYVMIKLIFGGTFADEAMTYNNLARMQREGEVRADVDIDLTVYIYTTLQYNIQRYIEQKGIKSQEEIDRVQHYVYYDLLRLGIKGHYDEKREKQSMGD